MQQIRNTILLKKIALCIKKLREDRHFTQEDVYIETNIHVGRIETAKCNVSISTLEYLCRYFKISLSDFFLLVEKIK